MTLFLLLTLVTIVTGAVLALSDRLSLRNGQLEVLKIGFFVLFFVLMLAELHPLLTGLRL